MRSLQICLALLLLAAPAFARGRDVSGHYERNGENDQASLDVTTLSGDRIKVTGIALWNTKNEKYGPNIGELEFEATLKNDTVTWSDADGYTEHAVGGHFGMNVTFAGHYARTAANATP